MAWASGRPPLRRDRIGDAHISLVIETLHDPPSQYESAGSNWNDPS